MYFIESDVWFWRSSDFLGPLTWWSLDSLFFSLFDVSFVEISLIRFRSVCFAVIYACNLDLLYVDEEKSCSLRKSLRNFMYDFICNLLFCLPFSDVYNMISCVLGFGKETWINYFLEGKTKKQKPDGYGVLCYAENIGVCSMSSLVDLCLIWCQSRNWITCIWGWKIKW